MTLTVLGSSSDGNSYVLQSETEALIIELGVHIDLILNAVNFDAMKIAFALCTHNHGDHAKSVKKALKAGIQIVMSRGTAVALGCEDHVSVVLIKHNQMYKSGNFTVMAFDAVHDCPEPLGFLINHPDVGTICFLTDSAFCDYRFREIDHFLIECNYDINILEDNVEKGYVHPKVKDRVINSHLSVETCATFLENHDLSRVKNIVLLHLSGDNSNPAKFKKRIQQATGRPVQVAVPSLDVQTFTINPF